MATEFNALKAKVDFSEVDKAREAFKNLAGEIPGASSAVDGLSSVISAMETPLLAVAGALAMATAGVIALGFRSIEAADKLNDMSLRTGKSAEYLQTLGDVATKSGTDLNTMISIFDEVQKKSAAGGEEGKKTGKAYEYLGVQARDASGKLRDSATLLEEGTAALDRMGRSADATAAFQDAFGASALKATPTLRNLNEEIDKQYEFLASVGALMDGNLMAAADEYNDRMTDLGSVFKGLGNDIARMMLPMLTGLADALVNSAKNSGALSAAFAILEGAAWLVIAAFKTVLTFFIAVDNGIANIVQSIVLAGQVIWAALTGNFDEIPKLWDAYKDRIVQTNVDAAAAVEKVWKKVDAAPQSKEDFKKGKGTGTSAAYNPFEKPEHDKGPSESGYGKELLSEEQGLIRLRAEYVKLFGIREQSHVQMVQAKIDAGEYNAKYREVDGVQKLVKEGLTAKQQATLLARAADQDYLATLLERAKAEKAAWDVVERARKANNDQITAMRQSNNEARIGREVMQTYGKTQDDVRIAISDFNIAQAQTALAIAKATNATEQEIEVLENKLETLKEIKSLQMDEKDGNDAEKERQRTFQYGWKNAFDRYVDDATNAAKMGASAFGSASKNMEDAIFKFATSGKFSFSDFAKSVLEDLARIAAKQAAVAIIKSAAGSWFADGGAFDTGGVKYFADGDVFNSPTAFKYSGGLGVMGEAGPEAVMPLRRGADGKLGVASSGGGRGGGDTHQYNISVTVGSVDSNERMTEMMKALEGVIEVKTKKTMAEQMRRGNMLNPA